MVVGHKLELKTEESSAKVTVILAQKLLTFKGSRQLERNRPADPRWNGLEKSMR